MLPPLPYTHFSYRSLRLHLKPAEIALLETTFAATRYVSNYFVTTFQSWSGSRLQNADLSVEGMKQRFIPVLQSKDFDLFNAVHPAYLEAEFELLSNRWIGSLNRKTPAPVFRNMRDDQSAWVMLPDAEKVYEHQFILPGSPKPIVIGPPATRMIGTPSIMQLTRHRHRYYLGVLYERAVLRAPRLPGMITEYGYRLQSHLYHVSNEHPVDWTVSPNVIRKIVLDKLITARFEKPSFVPTLSEEKFHDELELAICTS